MDDKKNQHKPVKSVDSFKNLIGLENDVFWEKGDFKSAESSDSDLWIDSSSSSDDSDIVESEWFANDGTIDAKPKYDFDIKPITHPKFDFKVKPITSVGPKCDLKAKPIKSLEPKYDFEAKPIKSLEPKVLGCWTTELREHMLSECDFSSSFHKYQQEDAHEFLQCFLNRLESRCSDVVQQVFGGRIVSKLRCCNCGNFSNTYEPLIDMSLEIKDAESLHSALESFTRVEKLDDPEIKFTCERCKAQVSIEKKCDGVMRRSVWTPKFHRMYRRLHLGDSPPHMRRSVGPSRRNFTRILVSRLLTMMDIDGPSIKRRSVGLPETSVLSSS
ncbi:hypothetical protein FXO38_09418 [Capsicum annuum]|nr:hypothetical protein FXO38_09418 [Capsicum annuum]